MDTKLTTEQQHRYMNDVDFHARVTVVSIALWEAIATHDLHQTRAFPYDRLIPETKDDLIVYAVAAVEALEALEPR